MRLIDKECLGHSLSIGRLASVYEGILSMMLPQCGVCSNRLPGQLVYPVRSSQQSADPRWTCQHGYIPRSLEPCDDEIGKFVFSSRTSSRVCRFNLLSSVHSFNMFRFLSLSALLLSSTFVQAHPAISRRGMSTGMPVCLRLIHLAVAPGLLTQLEYVAQYAAAAYCPANNVPNSPAEVVCNAGNCPLVEAAQATTLVEFQK